MKHLLILFAFLTSMSYGQSAYPNFDFELGNLNNWTFSTSTRPITIHSLSTVPVLCTPPLSSTVGCGNKAWIYDTVFTKSVSNCTLTSVTPKPGRYIMFLSSMSKVTIASYQFTVNASAPVLNIQYLQQLTGSEGWGDGPFTQIAVKDVSNAVLPGTFIDYSKTTHSSVAIPSASSDFCLGWGTYTSNLSAYIGQVLRVEIIIAACAFSGHSPASYFDGYFSTVTGIKESELNKSIQIVPNPANDFISIKKPFNEDLKILIFDTQGKLMKEEVSEKIDISDLQKGLYFVKAIGKEGNYSKSFIKE